MYFRLFETKFGTAGLVSRGKLINAFYLPDKRTNIIRRVKKDFPGSVLRSNTEIRKAEALLKRYFTGQKVSFKKIRTELDGMNLFARSVLKRTASISYGAVRTYKWAGNGKSRAAGKALGSNPVPVLIPCHRIIKSDGKLGGYSGGRGWKRRLLQLEGAL
jgi:O-6-methylguanine DNA methyltransferase